MSMSKVRNPPVGCLRFCLTVRFWEVSPGPRTTAMGANRPSMARVFYVRSPPIAAVADAEGMQKTTV
jgi:hypothetical protein